jgi:hypothetical protein
VAYTSGALGLHEVLEGSIGRGTGPEFRAVPVRETVSGFTGAEMDCIRARVRELLRLFWSTFLRKKPCTRYNVSFIHSSWRVLPSFALDPHKYQEGA